METRTYNVYKFDELPKEAKEKAINRWREDGLDYEWYDTVYEDVFMIAKIIGIDLNRRSVKLMNGETRYDPAIYFSGFSSQGDGACFEGTYQYAKDSVRKIKEYAPQDKELHRITEGLYNIQKKHSFKVTANVKHSGHYYHSHSTLIDVDPGKMYEEISELLRDFMNWIYNTLEKEYEFLMRDETIIETIRANDYNFTEDGEID